MEGKNVLFPIGFDAFGLPTENFAIKTGKPPAEVTKKNIANFTRQLKMLGFDFDFEFIFFSTLSGVIWLVATLSEGDFPFVITFLVFLTLDFGTSSKDSSSLKDSSLSSTSSSSITHLGFFLFSSTLIIFH
jgi:hypothetical protein